MLGGVITAMVDCGFVLIDLNTASPWASAAATTTTVDVGSTVTMAHHQLRFERNPHTVQCAPIAEHAIIGSPVVGMALDEADPAMPRVDQMRSHVVGGLRIVHEHG